MFRLSSAPYATNHSRTRGRSTTIQGMRRKAVNVMVAVMMVVMVVVVVVVVVSMVVTLVGAGERRRRRLWQCPENFVCCKTR